MNDHEIPKPVDSVQLQDFAGELVVYDLARTRVVYLSDTAALVWRLCDGRRTVKEIIELLTSTYPQNASHVPDEVRATVKALEEQQALSALSPDR